MRMYFLLLLLLARDAYGQAYHITMVNSGTDASFRGLSVVDDNVAWVSGTKGHVGRSVDGGKHWTFKNVAGFERSDFRSIYAFNSRKAVIACTGSPARILLTIDGGDTWKDVYRNDDSAAFMDGIAFTDEKNGLAYGDPINGKLMLARTTDGGRTWRDVPMFNRPTLVAGEASFAASGTSVRALPRGHIAIATGGAEARLFITSDLGDSWRSLSTFMLHGKSSEGIFSIAGHGRRLIIVGGDYKRDTLREDHVFYSGDEGLNWRAPKTLTRGYRECVEYVASDTLIAVGPTGMDISYDDGVNWSPLSDEREFHVIRKSGKGNLIIMAGGDGKLAIVSE